MAKNLETDTIIQKIIQWTRDRDDVRAVLLTSTRAIAGGTIDLFSDYDIILIVTDIYPYFEDDGWLKDFGDVLVRYRDPIRLLNGFEKFAFITQYEQGHKIDFTVWPVEIVHSIVEADRLPHDLDVGYVVLLDKDQLTYGLQPPSYQAYIPNPPSESEFHEMVREFFHEATYVAKHLVRRELIPAKYNLDYRMKHVNLVTMLQWRLEIDQGWFLKPGAYGKGLKEYLDEGIWSMLEATYVGAGFEENWQAFFRTIDLFRKVAVEVSIHLGFEYPFQFDERMMVYLNKVNRLDSNRRINGLSP
jgi:aminoglycoside 6-adenylyltransferase